MKRKLLALAALAVVLSVTAVACGDKNDKPADTTADTVTTTAPADETTEPADDTTVADETTEPADDTTVADETTAPADDTTVADETTEPEETTAAPVVIPGEYSYPFTSDVSSNEEGADLQETDLFLCFSFNYGLADPHHILNGKYVLGGINEMVAETDGFYAFSIVMDNVVSVRGGNAYAFCRGVQDVSFTGLSEDSLTESIRPIGQFYEDDGTTMLGGAGIYATITNGKLLLVIKYFDPTALKGVANRAYELDVDSNKLTFADNGETVYILAGDTLVATIELSGSKDYDEIATLPISSFAETAKITLNNGIVETIENTLIAATANTQVGMAARAGKIEFSSVSIQGFSSVTIPDMAVNALEVENTSALVGNPVYVYANGTATDYVAIYAEGSDTILNKIYLTESGKIDVTAGLEAPIAAGKYVVCFVPNDGDISAATVSVTISILEAGDMIYNLGEAGSLVTGNCFDAISSDADGYATNLKADSFTVPAGSTELKLWGWAGFKCESFAFGYIIDNNDPVIKDEFIHVFTENDEGDKNAIAGVVAAQGGIASGRHDIRVDLTGLAAGTYTIRAVAQQENGAMTVLLQFTITIE